MRILLRASRTPFQNFFSKEVPQEHLAETYKALHKPETKNIGNLLVSGGAHKILSTETSKIEIDNYEMTLTRSFADKAVEINEQFDAFVIPQTNAFRSNYRTELVRMTKTIQKLKIPCVVTGIGAQGDITNNFSCLSEIKQEVHGFVSAVLDKSHSIGVRGEATKKYLNSLGFSDRYIDVIGCPSMFYNGSNIKIRSKQKAEQITINLSVVPQELRKNFIALTKQFNNTDLEITYIPQTRNMMPYVIKKTLPYKNILGNQVLNLFKKNKVLFFCDLLPWINFLKTQDFVIGTRMHGNVAALLAGTAAHVIVHDSRTRELVEYFEIPHTLMTDIKNDKTVEQYYKESDFERLEKNHKTRVRVYADFLEKNGLEHILYNEELLNEYDRKMSSSLSGVLS